MEKQWADSWAIISWLVNSLRWKKYCTKNVLQGKGTYLELSRLRQGVEDTEDPERWEIERMPKSLGPPEAIVEQVELWRVGPAMAGNADPRSAATSSGSQCKTTVTRPLLSITFHEGTLSWRPKEYRVSQTMLGIISMTAEIEANLKIVMENLNFNSE